MPEEFALTGAQMARRGARTAEYIRALHALWADGVSEFNGEFYRVPRGDGHPSPVQPGGPPILLGGLARPALERVGPDRRRLGHLEPDRPVAGQRADRDRARGGREAAGRDPAALRVVCRGVVRPGEPQCRARTAAGCCCPADYAQIREDAESLADQGVTELFYDLNWDPQIGSPDADPAAATARATEILDALAPASSAVPAGQARPPARPDRPDGPAGAARPRR